jgi:hypothetical protein
MQDSLFKYMKVGLVHFMAYPATLKGEGPIVETIKKLVLECVTNEKNVSSFQCCIRDEGRSFIYALREEYINHFMVL